MKKRNYAALLLSCLMLLAPVSGGINAAAEEEPAPFDPDSVPGVIPAIREWNGDTSDYFTLDAGTVLLNTAKSASVKKVAGFFKDMCGIEPLCVYEDNGGKVIEFVISDTLPDRVTDEGYTLGITKDRVTVTAKTDVGLLYGGITLVQMNYYEGVIRCGSAVDYPEYPLRSGMLDVGRMWIPLDYVEEITKYMAWFKLNEIHLHINDHDGDGNTGFRLESDIPGLSTVKNGEKQYYTKDEYRAYQKRMLEYGVTVVTEIDTPAHSGAFSKVTEGGPSMIGGKSLDIRDEHREETLEFVKKVFDEYLLGDDPVFVGKVVHIGTDEYDRAYSEEMRKYTAALAEYIYSLGYTPRFWAGFGKSGFQGETEIPGFLQANFWDNDISGLDETVAGGYDIINTLNSLLYTVPTGNGFPDYLDLEYLYKNWQVYLFNGWGYNKKVEKGYEHLLGACFALWNDLGFKNFGITKYDVFDRLRGMVAIVSEKAWTGDQTSQIPVSDFMTRFEKLSLYAGTADPGRHKNVCGTHYGDNVSINFEGEQSGGKYILDGNNEIAFTIDSYGFPGSLSLTFCLDEFPEGALLSSGDCEILLDADGKGRVGFIVDHYTFIYDYKAPKGEEVTLTFICDGSKTVLCVGGEIKDGAVYGAFGYEAENTINKKGNRLATMVFPVGSIGKGAKGYVSDISLYGFALDYAPIIINRNLALNRPVTVSGLEVNDGRFTAPLAVDGNPDTRVSFARDKDEQWMIVDLGDVFDVDHIVIDFFQQVTSYDVFVSVDGKEYTKVYGTTEGVERAENVTDDISLPQAYPARYVKYVQNKRNYYESWNAYYSGGISEFSVYAYDPASYDPLIEQAKAKIDELNGTDEAKRLKSLVSELKRYRNSDFVYKANIERIVSDINALLEDKIPDESEDISETSVEGYGESGLSGGAIAGIIAACAAAAAGIAFAVFAVAKKRKKKDGSAE